MNVLKTIVAGILFACCVSLICVMADRMANKRNDQQKLDCAEFFKNPPAEYKKFESDIEQFCNRFHSNQERFKRVYDLHQITNASWRAEVKPVISEIKEIVLSISDRFEDAEIYFSSNEYVVAELLNKKVHTMESIDAFDTIGRFSPERLSDLEELYSLLNRHRALWRIENGKFVFTNKELEMKCEILFVLIEAEDSN